MHQKNSKERPTLITTNLQLYGAYRAKLIKEKLSELLPVESKQQTFANYFDQSLTPYDQAKSFRLLSNGGRIDDAGKSLNRFHINYYHAFQPLTGDTILLLTNDIGKMLCAEEIQLDKLWLILR